MNVLQDGRDPPGVEAVGETDETCPVAQHVSQVHEHLGRSREGHPVNRLKRAHRSGEPTDNLACDDCCGGRSHRRDARPPLSLSQHGNDARAEHRRDAVSDHQEVAEHSEGERGERRRPSPVEAVLPQSDECKKSQGGRTDVVRATEQEGAIALVGNASNTTAVAAPAIAAPPRCPRLATSAPTTTAIATARAGSKLRRPVRSPPTRTARA